MGVLMKTGLKVTFIIFPFDLAAGPISFDGAMADYQIQTGTGTAHT